MPRATATRIAELLVAEHSNEESFDVDFLDGPFTELAVEALQHLGCRVERVGPGSRLRVHQSDPAEKT